MIEASNHKQRKNETGFVYHNKFTIHLFSPPLEPGPVRLGHDRERWTNNFTHSGIWKHFKEFLACCRQVSSDLVHTTSRIRRYTLRNG